LNPSDERIVFEFDEAPRSIEGLSGVYVVPAPKLDLAQGEIDMGDMNFELFSLVDTTGTHGLGEVSE
jgi:hypothetical protein